MVAVEALVDHVGGAAIERELDVARLRRLVDVDLADQVAVAGVQLVDAEADDVVERWLHDAAVEGLGGERCVGEPREHRGAGLLRQRRLALEEALAEVVLLLAANPELTRHLGGCTIGHEGDGRHLVERPLPRVLRLAGRRVGGDGEHGRHRRVGEVDLAHVRVTRWLFGEVVRHVGRPSVARDGDGTGVRPGERDAIQQAEVRVEDEELARALARDDDAVARRGRRDAVRVAADAENVGAHRGGAPQIRLVEAGHAVVILVGGVDVGTADGDRARVALVEGRRAGARAHVLFAGERAGVHRVELEARQAVGVGVDDEDVPVRRDGDGARSRWPGERRGRPERRGENGPGGSQCPHGAALLGRAADAAPSATSPYKRQSRATAARSAITAGASGSRSQINSSNDMLRK